MNKLLNQSPLFPPHNVSPPAQHSLRSARKAALRLDPQMQPHLHRRPSTPPHTLHPGKERPHLTPPALTPPFSADFCTISNICFSFPQKTKTTRGAEEKERGVGRGSPHMRRFSFSCEELSGKKENEELHFWLWRRHIFSPHVGSLSPFLQRGTQALLGQLYKQKERKNWNKGRGEAGRTLPYPQERICNSAAAAALITVRLCWSLQQKIRAKREKTARNGEGTWKPGWAESLDRGGERASLDCKQSVYELKSHRFNADCRKTSNKLDCAAYTLLEANNMTRNHPLSFTGTLKEGQRKPWEMDYKYSTRSLIYWGNRLILRLPKFSAEL